MSLDETGEKGETGEKDEWVKRRWAAATVGPVLAAPSTAHSPWSPRPIGES